MRHVNSCFYSVRDSLAIFFKDNTNNTTSNIDPKC